MTQIGILANQFKAFSSKLRQPIKLKQVSLGGKILFQTLVGQFRQEEVTSNV